MDRRLPDMSISVNLLLIGIFLSRLSGFGLSAIVTLDSIEILKTHEFWKSAKPDVYFLCKSENKTDLPDLKTPHQLYKFHGQESWQPLTELSENKCKRCGFYERDLLSDDTFDEWEFCLSDFSADGKYTRFKENEINATFSCQQCKPSVSVAGSNSHSGSDKEEKEMHVAVIIVICALVSTVIILGGIVMFKYWQKRKRQQDQARFLKLFEDGDDIEDELGLGNVL